jgi:UDP-N-acetylglucosamine acyltransferase
VGNHVTIGGIVPIHQFTRIGDYAFVAAAARPFMDVVPFAMCSGDPTRVTGINRVGLERHGFDGERRQDIKRAYRILFRENLVVDNALAKLEESFPGNGDIRMIIDFVKGSSRGVMRMRGDAAEEQ